MGTRINMVGEKSGRLTVISYQETRNNRAYWKCQCICGKIKIVYGKHIRNKSIQSCGCLHHDWVMNYNTKHGNRIIGNTSPEYSAWQNMKERCYNPKNISYPNYGGRGICVCDEWINSFEKFLSDMGKRSPGLSIDRIDNSKGYSKDNCRWANKIEQMSNTRRNKYIEHDGKRLSYAAWDRLLKLKPRTISRRIARGWSIEMALCTPLLNTNRTNP